MLLFILSGCVGQLVINYYPISEPAYQMFGKVPQRNFYHNFNLPDSLELFYEDDTKGSFHNGTVAVQGKYVFLTELAGNLYGFNTDTLAVEGYDENDGEAPVSPILYEGWIYYIANIYDETYAKFIVYDINDGERRREVEVPGAVHNEMLMVNEMILFVNDVGTVYCYDRYGYINWEKELNIEVYSSPAADNEKIYISTNEGEIIALKLDDGTEVFRKKLSNRTEASVTIDNSVGYIGDEKGILYAFDTFNGKLIWKFDTGSKIKNLPVFNDEFIYIGNLKGDFFCLYKKSGKIKWELLTDGIFNAAPLLFDNLILVPDSNEKIIFVDPLNGEILKTWNYDTRVKMTPVYFEDKLYVGIDRGELLVYKPYEHSYEDE